MPETVYGSDGIAIMSRSMLEASQCGLRYSRLYVEGMTDESTISRRGSAYHKVKKCYIKRLAAAQVEMDAEESVLAFQEGIAEAKATPDIIAEVRSIFERHREHFVLNLDAYVASEERRVITAEDGLQFILEPDLEYAWAQRNEFETVDDKTYYVGFTDAQAEQMFQTRYYIWAQMQDHPGFATYRMTYNFVRLNTFATCVFTPDQFDELDREVRAGEASRRQRHAEQDWTAQPGDVCAFCTFACPVADDPRRAIVRVHDKDTFALLAGKELVEKKRRQAEMKALKQFCVQNGPQNVQGEVFDHYKSVSRSYPAAVVVDRARSLGLQPDFTVTASALKRFVKASPPTMADSLKAVEMTKETARFGSKSEKAIREAVSDDQDGDE